MTPARLSVAGGVTTLTGIGFIPGLGVDNGANSGVVLMQSATQLQISLPAATVDGIATVEVTSPATGSFSQMQGALTYGAAANDLLMLLNGGSQTAPLGAQAPSMIRVRATASDGVTPVNGATIAWSATNGVELSACNAAASCSVLTDGSGEAATWVTPTAFGQGTISAALAPAAYQPAQTQLATLQGTESTLDLAAVAPTRWLAQGVTLNVALTVEALDMGVPQANVNIKFIVTNGTASLSSSTATTNSSGLASTTAQLTNLSGTVQVSACVSPAENPCQTFTLLAVPAASWTLEAVSGALQIVPNGQTFQPLIMRVTDGSANDNPVQGASVTFLTTLERNPQGSGGGPPQGDADRRQSGAREKGVQQSGAQQDDSPVIIGTSQSQAATDQNGLATITPTVGSLGPCDAFITVSAGLATAQYELQNVDPLTSNPQLPVRQAASPSVRFFPPFNALSTAPQDAAPQLIAIPEGILVPAQDPPPDDAPPAADSNSTSGNPDGANSVGSVSIAPSSGPASVEDAQPKPPSAPTSQDPQAALPNSPSTDNPKTAAPAVVNQPPATSTATPH